MDRVDFTTGQPPSVCGAMTVCSLELDPATLLNSKRAREGFLRFGMAKKKTPRVTQSTFP